LSQTPATINYFRVYRMEPHSIHMALESDPPRKAALIVALEGLLAAAMAFVMIAATVILLQSDGFRKDAEFTPQTSEELTAAPVQIYPNR